MVHVLTGPDHLSAISQLTAGSETTRWRAAGLGLRWGLGHSTGLGIIAAVFFGVGQRLDLGALSGVGALQRLKKQNLTFRSSQGAKKRFRAGA